MIQSTCQGVMGVCWHTVGTAATLHALSTCSNTRQTSSRTAQTRLRPELLQNPTPHRPRCTPPPHLRPRMRTRRLPPPRPEGRQRGQAPPSGAQRATASTRRRPDGCPCPCTCNARAPPTPPPTATPCPTATARPARSALPHSALRQGSSRGPPPHTHMRGRTRLAHALPSSTEAGSGPARATAQRRQGS